LVKEKKKNKKDKLATPFGREFSAGGVVFKKKGGNVLWLISKSSPSRLFPQSYWRLPKGWLDDIPDKNLPGPLASGKKKASQEQLIKAAIREVAEEAGIRVKIVQKIGTETYSFAKDEKRVLKFVTYFLMEWESDLPQGFGYETESIDWVDFAVAHKRLKHSGEKKFLKKAYNLLASLKL
jgi:8-oxo-dGTP pyrophosphatase MutT (NUDIX family)